MRYDDDDDDDIILIIKVARLEINYPPTQCALSLASRSY